MRTPASRSSAAQAPALSFGTPVVVALVTVSVVLALASWGSVWLPEPDGSPLSSLRQGVRAEQPRSVLFWWLTAVFVIASLAASAQAIWRYHRRTRLASAAWWTVAAAMAWISVDHAVALHELVPRWTGPLLPGVLGEYPVESLLVVAAAPAGLVAMATALSWGQRVLLAGAALAYLVGEVVVGSAVVDLQLGTPRHELLESVLQWTGAILVVAAAGRGSRDRRSPA